jgi:spore germination protein
MPRSLPRVILLCSLIAAAGRAGGEPAAPVERPPDRPGFREVWAYLMRGEEAALTGVEPVSDVCLFSARLSRDGRLVGAPKRPPITMADGYTPRVHLVVAELSNDVLIHLALDPRYQARPLLVEDICRAAEGFDGVQVDFEVVARDDAPFFLDFLREIRERLPVEKLLSVAVPARVKPLADAYDYASLASVADRLIVMAYDEHWSGSAPGPVASLAWCARIADYAMGAAADRAVMGLPLYGRAWPDKALSRALRFAGVQDLIAEKEAAPGYDPGQGPSFEYTESVTVRVFYDDERSLGDKLRLYKEKNVGAVSFWRIGQGPPGLWAGLELEGRPRASGTPPAVPAPVLRRGERLAPER